MKYKILTLIILINYYNAVYLVNISPTQNSIFQVKDNENNIYNAIIKTNTSIICQNNPSIGYQASSLYQKDYNSLGFVDQHDRACCLRGETQNTVAVYLIAERIYSNNNPTSSYIVKASTGEGVVTALNSKIPDQRILVEIWLKEENNKYSIIHKNTALDQNQQYTMLLNSKCCPHTPYRTSNQELILKKILNPQTNIYQWKEILDTPMR